MNDKHNNFLRKVSIGILLPVLLVCVVVLMAQSMSHGQNQVPEQPQGTEPEPMDFALNVIFGEEIRVMDLDTYLTGVVLGEMPASFEMDALRSQAVAARTYTLKRCMDGQRHGKNTICTDHTCCQAYTEPNSYMAAGGSESSVLRVQQAVMDTSGEVLVYDGELIVATYFACAGDVTEDAVAVWGQDYPYLQSVPSPGEEGASYYTDSKTFTAEQFQKALGIRLEGAVDQWFGQLTYTNGGGVETMYVCGIPYRGTTLRTLLDLRSTAFAVSVHNGQITFQTKGFGHRVGMSQYGANAMAKTGKNYREILTYYYTGVEIVQYIDENGKTQGNFS